jgi:hypothetical protein
VVWEEWSLAYDCASPSQAEMAAAAVLWRNQLPDGHGGEMDFSFAGYSCRVWYNVGERKAPRR